MQKAKAVVLEGKRMLRIARFEKPNIDSKKILVQTEISGICGTDVHVYEGHLDAPYPIIPGHEFIGKIVEIGEKAKNLETRRLELGEGDRISVVPGTNSFCGKCYFCRSMPHKPNLCENRRVYGFMSCKEPPHLLGGWAEYIYIDPAHFSVFRLPGDFDPEVAVLIEPMAVASRAFERAFAPGLPTCGEGFGPGKNVLIQGAGSIGLLTVTLAKLANAHKVIAIDSVEDRLEKAHKLGATDTINMKAIPRSDKRIEEVKKLTNGVGADVVLECTGAPAAVPEGIEMARNGGKFIEVGHFSDPGGIEIHPHRICRKDIDILGSWVYPPWQFETAINLLYKNKDIIPFKNLLTHKFSLEEADKAMNVALNREGLKIAFVMP